jgi:hypothetical protein
MGGGSMLIAYCNKTFSFLSDRSDEKTRFELSMPMRETTTHGWVFCMKFTADDTVGVKMIEV